jgi:hypothetical protein
MSTFELELLAGAAARQTEQKLTPFDYATKLLLPGLSLVALIWTRNIQPRLSWGLLALAFVSLIVGFHQPIADAFRNRSQRRGDRRVARNAFPELRKFAHRFEEFIGNQASTLHYIAQCDVCEGHGQQYNALGLPDISVWQAFLRDFTDRLDRMDLRRATTLELRHALTAFFDLVGTYNHSCVSVLFDRLPQSEREALTTKAKSSLNSFQQRFGHFLEDYKNFAKDLSQARPALADVHYIFSIPKPIS